jgi:hypothetical protein
VPPGHVRTLDDYWLWLEQLIAASGGYLDDDTLLVSPLEDAHGEVKELLIRQHRLNFWNDTFLSFSMVVSDSLEQVRYSYHYQRRGGALIFRKDNVHVHRGQDETPHVHRDPARPYVTEPFDEVDLEEALSEVAEYAERFTLGS